MTRNETPAIHSRRSIAVTDYKGKQTYTDNWVISFIERRLINLCSAQRTSSMKIKDGKLNKLNKSVRVLAKLNRVLTCTDGCK